MRECGITGDSEVSEAVINRMILFAILNVFH